MNKKANNKKTSNEFVFILLQIWLCLTEHESLYILENFKDMEFNKYIYWVLWLSYKLSLSKRMSFSVNMEYLCTVYTYIIICIYKYIHTDSDTIYII